LYSRKPGEKCADDAVEARQHDGADAGRPGFDADLDADRAVKYGQALEVRQGDSQELEKVFYRTNEIKICDARKSNR